MAFCNEILVFNAKDGSCLMFCGLQYIRNITNVEEKCGPLLWITLS